MKKIFKRIVSSATALAMTLSLFNGIQLTSFAEETPVMTGNISAAVAGMGEADNDIALEYYIGSQLMGDYGISMFDYRTNAADVLYQAELDIYNDIVTIATDIANGVEGADTAEIPFGLEWSYADLGLSSNCTQEEFNAAGNLAFNSINFDAIYSCILADLPYELYWHDKSQENSFYIQAGFSGDGATFTMTGTISLLVASGYGSGTTVNSRPASVSAAVDNILDIVDENAGKTDLEILTAYKEKICEITSYNHAALEPSTPYGDPWQLIYVFDGDSSTNVVCEGYSKAFKQLCDITEFSKPVYCYLVDGFMDSEAHMWNIVEIDGGYYHVDITNSDAGTTGAAGGLFLNGVTYTNAEKTSFRTSTNDVYVFDDASVEIFPTETAGLSSEDYSGPAKTISSVAVKTNPAKTAYYAYDEFEPEGLELTVNYSDSTSETVAYSAENEGDFSFDYGVLTVGVTAVTVTYNEKTAVIPVTVSKTFPSVQVTYDSSKKYYDSMNSEDIPLSADMEGVAAFRAGQTLTAGKLNDLDWTFTPEDTDNYKSVSGVLRVYIYADTLDSITVKTEPLTTYTVGDTFDPTGLVITASYASGDKDITYSEADKGDFAFSPAVLAADTDVVTVTYGGKTAEIDVTVNKMALDFTAPAPIADLRYNGEAQTLVTAGSVPDGATIWYKLGNGEYSETLPTAKDVGTYTVYYKVTGGDNYDDVPETSFEVTIASYAGVVTITEAELAEGNGASGIGWKIEDDILTLDEGYEFVFEGTCNVYTHNKGTIVNGVFSDYVINDGTIQDGTYNKIVGNNSIISGGDFVERVENSKDAVISGGTFTEIMNSGTIAVTDNSVVVTVTSHDSGTVTVNGVTHTHSTVTEYAAHTIIPDVYHLKNERCENCPVNYVDSQNESHSGSCSEVSGNDIVIECICGMEYGSFTIVMPSDLTYDKNAKAVTVTGEIEGVETPVVEYYDVNGTKLESAPVNAGTYTAHIISGDLIVEKEFEIVKATPVIAPSLAGPSVVYETTSLDEIKLSSGTDIAGTIAFDGNITLSNTVSSYPVIFTPEDTANYNTVTGTVQISVLKNDITDMAVKTAPTKTTYAEGEAFDPAGLVITVTYANGDTEDVAYSDATAAAFTFDPSTLTVGATSVSVSYNNLVDTIAVVVKGALTADDFVATLPATIVYSGTPQDVLITGNGAEITIKYYDGDRLLDSTPVDAGTYTVKIDVAESDNYAAATDLTDPSWILTIEKATPVIAPGLAGPSVVYDTTSLDEIKLSSGTDIAGTIAFDGNITLSEDVSSYPVIFTPTDTANYNTVTGTVTISVVKDSISGISVKSAPSKTEYTYGEAFDPTGLVIETEYLSGNTETVAYDDNASAFSFSPDELTIDTTAVTVTYAGKTANVTITVEKATPEVTVPANLTATYGDTLADVTLPTGWSWNNPLASVGNAGSRTFAATYDNNDPNYNVVNREISITVSQKTISVEDVVVNDKEYDGTTDAVVNKVTFTGVIADDNIGSEATAVFSDKNAGEDKSVIVTITISNANYVLDKNTFAATASISKANPDVTIPTTASAITGLPLSRALLPDGWAWDDATVIPVDGNKYGATYVPADTRNYNTLTTEITVTVSDCTHSETSETVNNASCTTDGLKTVVCDICGETVSTEVIPAGHKWNTTYTVDVPASCTTDGIKSIHCKNCTEIKPDSETVIPSGHDWNDRYSSDNDCHWVKCKNCDEIKDKGKHEFGYTLASKNMCAICNHSYTGGSDSSSSDSTTSTGAGFIYPIHFVPGSTEPQIMGENNKNGWEVICDELAFAQDGDAVVVDMNGTTKLPKKVLEAIEGRNIDLVLDMGRGILWTINGETVTNPKNVDMRVSKNVKRIPVDIIDNLTGEKHSMEISLVHNGNFGFEALLTISLNKKYDGLYANLYYYNPSDKDMEFIDCGFISGGNANLVFNHASDYAIVIDDEAHGEDVISASGIEASSEEMNGETTVSVMFVLPVILAAGFVIRKKLCR